MGLDYLNSYSYYENLTSPLSRWHRGTTFQFDVMTDRPQTPVVLTDLGTDVVMVTMAARIMHSIVLLGKNFLQKQASYWKMFPRTCVNKALRAVMWVCCSVIDLLLPSLITTVYVYKKQSRCKTVHDAETMKCHWGSQTEPVEELKMEMVQEFAKMEEDHTCEVVKKKDLLPSCTNSFILSMICMPSEHVGSSEESEVDSVGELEGDCSQEKSVDSGMQESWTPQSKCEEDDCGEESDWSDEDSWDEESNSCNEEEDLLASFCRSDDPYNPFSFAMPTRSSDQPKKEPPIKTPETHQILEDTKVVKTDCGTVTAKQNQKLCKKPVLSGYKSSHKCTLLKEESMEEGNHCTKKVRFSTNVTIHPIVTWSFAHRMARKGPWEEYARDRSRFQRRIAETEAAISFCLDADHRDQIWARLYSQEN